MTWCIIRCPAQRWPPFLKGGPYMNDYHIPTTNSETPMVTKLDPGKLLEETQLGLKVLNLLGAITKSTELQKVLDVVTPFLNDPQLFTSIVDIFNGFKGTPQQAVVAIAAALPPK